MDLMDHFSLTCDSRHPPASCGSARPRVNAAQTRIERFISSQHKSSWTLLTLDVFGSARAALGTAAWLCPRGA